MTHAHSTESVQSCEPDCYVRAVYMTDATGNYGRENKLHITWLAFSDNHLWAQTYYRKHLESGAVQ